MSAGLPGLGLGGLFFIFSAFLAPFPELWRTVRGRSDLAAWRAIGRQLAQAVAMVVAVDLTLRLTYLVLAAAGAGDPPAADDATVLPLNLIGITTGLLFVVLCGAKLAELALRVRGGGLGRVPAALPRVAPVQAVAFAGVAVVAWIALLATGASQLSPLQPPPREQSAPRPEQAHARSLQEAAVEPLRRGQPGSQPAATDTMDGTGVQRGGSGTASPAGAPEGEGGRADIAASPAVAAPSPSNPPQYVESAPAPTSHPESSHAVAPAQPPKAPPAEASAGSPPEPARPAEGAPASEGAGPVAEPPPQAPANGLRSAE